MFTGLVEAKGTLLRAVRRGADARLVIQGVFGDEPIALGESIAIDGVCLTVDTIVEKGQPGPSVVEFDASAETLAKTTLGALTSGAHVNLERAVRLGARMGGHIVSGHVDGVGRIVSITPLGESRKIVFEAPAELARYVAPKGSICVSGVSLTVNGVTGSTFDVVVIPHTQEKTSLDVRRPGDTVNLEVDLLARYVARLLQVGLPTASDAASTRNEERDAAMVARLKDAGYL